MKDKVVREVVTARARMALCMRLVRVLSWLHLGCPPSVNAETMRACWLHIETHAEFAASEADAVSPRTKADGDLGPFKLAILVDAVCMCYERASRDAVTLLQHPYTLLELVSEPPSASTAGALRRGRRGGAEVGGAEAAEGEADEGSDEEAGEADTLLAAGR